MELVDDDATEREARPPSSVWRESVADLVSLVRDGDRLAVGGFHFTRAPVALLTALLESERRGLHYVSWGGGLPLEMLLAGDRVDRATLCFSALEVFGPAPRFRRAVEQSTIAFSEMTALTMMSGLRARGERLDRELMPTPAGSVFAETLTPVASDGMPTSEAPAIEIDTLLLHAQRADDDGNVEIQGARGLDLSVVMAARRVLVTVEERVPVGGLGAPRAHILPRGFVTALAVAEFGAYPTACLPYYAQDLETLADALDGEEQHFVDALAGTESARRAAARRASPSRTNRAGAAVIESDLRKRARRSRAADADSAPSRGEILVWTIARSVRPGDVCAFGSASLIPAAAYLLAKRTHAPSANLISSNGGYIDLATRAMYLELAEAFDFASAIAFMGGDENYRWYNQSGRTTHEVVGAAQVDQFAATNNLWISREDGGVIRLPGQGGMADVANLHENFCIYLPRQSKRNLVAAVERVSSSRAWFDDDERRGYGLRPGRVEVVTDLAVFRLDAADRRLRVASIHPGVDRGEILDATGFEPSGLDDAPETPVPDRDVLRVLREEVDPLGISRLDAIPARERPGAIRDIVRRERLLMDRQQ